MSKLWEFHQDENWQYFLKHTVPVEWKRNEEFYIQIKKDNLFTEEIYKVLATLSDCMFKRKIENYNKWLFERSPMLDGFSPSEVALEEHGVDWIKEYLVRYPCI